MKPELVPTAGPHTPSNPRYPDIEVELSEQDGNAYSIIGRCRKALRRADINPREIDAFTNEATSRDYDHLLQTVMKWFNVS